MPFYDYHCEANGRTVEVMHGIRDVLKNWGEVCVKAEIEPGGTPLDSPVIRLIGFAFSPAKKIRAVSSRTGRNHSPGGCCGGCH